MDEHLFKSTKTGKLVWVNEGMYYRFEPNNLPFDYIPSNKISSQLTKTALALGKLNGLSHKFSANEIRLMQYPFELKEAQLSSEIEGTRSTITDVYKSEKVEEKDPEKRLDNEEIKNYRKALAYALKEENEPLSENLIKEFHKILLFGVRGKDKNPGEYKEIQNAIGKREDSLDTAKFVPASPESVPSLMSNLIDFINSQNYDPLYKIAIAHYQFETIHPFRDGNGRLGRLLIILRLCKEKLLEHPLLYISEYFNRNRDTYTDNLFNVSSKGDIEGWILFFFKALEYQTNQSILLLNKLENYKSELHGIAKSVSKRSHRIHEIIDSLFKAPFLTIRDLINNFNLSQPGARQLIKKLEKLNIIKEYPTKQREKVYFAQEILTIIEG